MEIVHTRRNVPPGRVAEGANPNGGCPAESSQGIQCQHLGRKQAVLFRSTNANPDSNRRSEAGRAAAPVLRCERLFGRRKLARRFAIRHLPKNSDNFERGLNERIPAKSFYESIDHICSLAVELGEGKLR